MWTKLDGFIICQIWNLPMWDKKQKAYYNFPKRAKTTSQKGQKHQQGKDKILSRQNSVKA
jgi:hypothetical protein